MMNQDDSPYARYSSYGNDEDESDDNDTSVIQE